MDLSALPQPDTSIDWLPSRPQLVGDYPMMLPRPSAHGCADCSSAAYRVGFDSRRNLAGLSRIAAGPVLGRIGEVSVLGTTLPSWWGPVMLTASILGTGAGAYHGFKRNRGSVGWAIVWGLLGGMFPIITVPVAFAQGYAKPRGR